MKSLLSLVFVLAFAVFSIYPPEVVAAGFGRGRNNVQVNVGGGGNVRVNANNGFRRNNSAVQVNVGGGFNRGAQVNVFRGGAIPIRGASFGRINSFGSRTVVDGFGNIFEVNSFGQPLIRASNFRGFGVNTFGAFAAPHCF